MISIIGVTQGSCLDPFVFILYTFAALPYACILSSYADDIKIR